MNTVHVEQPATPINGVTHGQGIDAVQGAGSGQSLIEQYGIKAYTAEEIGAKVEGEGIVPIPAEYRAAASAMTEQVKAKLANHVSHNVASHLAARSGGPGLMAGSLIDNTGYEDWDLLALSPQQFINPPFVFRPHKIVAGGEFVLLTAALFINPLPTAGGRPPATVQLGDRGFRVRFEQMDLTNVENGIDFTFTGTFSSPAPTITIFQTGYFAPNPGVNPQLVEMNVTADITTPNMPYAAFATQWFDIEDDPGFPTPQPSGFRNLVPMRYLIYPE